MTFKAIETQYKGYRMRSRLEARWAVFFDVLDLDWEYELEGFDFGDMRYLPDLWLPQVKMWAEVKPTKLSAHEEDKVKALAKHTEHPCLMLIGVPSFKPYWAWELSWCEDTSELWKMDYALVSEYLYEHRFYSSCAGGYEHENEFSADYRSAVYAARSARFEHGERGYKPRKAWPGLEWGEPQYGELPY